MTPLTLAELVRRSFEDVASGDGPRELSEARELEPALADITLPELIALARDAEVAVERQDEVYGAIVRSYRKGPRPVWGAVLLEMLAPALIAAASDVAARGAATPPEDLDQQVLVETLATAAQIPLWRDQWLKRRIMIRVSIALVRWSAKQSPEVGQEPLAFVNAPDLIPLFELLRLCGEVLTPQQFALVYRTTVLREQLTELASEIGATPLALKLRRRRALARLRRHAA